MDILAWSFADWFTIIVISAAALIFTVYMLSWVILNRDDIAAYRRQRKSERRNTWKDPEYSEVADWADEKLFYETVVRGE